MSEFEDDFGGDVIVTTTKPAPKSATAKTKPKRQPQYSVIVLNDDLHTFEYVIEALCRICGHSVEDAFRLAVEIDGTGLAAVWKGSMELAELKRDQIIAFGPDQFARVPPSFPLGCYIEAVT